MCKIGGSALHGLWARESILNSIGVLTVVPAFMFDLMKGKHAVTDNRAKDYEQ